jgi:AraC-like DNA-binding protein
LHDGGIEVIKATLTEKDRRFMERVEKVLARRFFEAEFTAAEFADGVAMSERQLQRKLKALLNHSPRDYLRNYRLAKAKEMLATGVSVADAAFRVGFQSQSYFAKCFKAHYGITPSQVMDDGRQSITSQ